MTSVETVSPVTQAGTLSELVNDALLLTAESLGLRPALRLRSEIRALTSARVGRIVLASEDGALAQMFLGSLLGVTRLPRELATLPEACATYRFDGLPLVTLIRAQEEQEVVFDRDGGQLDLTVDVADPPSGVLHVDVALPSPLLSRFSVTHLPELHSPDGEVDGLATVTPLTVVVYVASAAQPLSAAEMQLIARMRERTSRLAVVVADVEAHDGSREVLAVNQALLGRAGVFGTGETRVFSDRHGAVTADQVQRWLAEPESTPIDEQVVDLVRTTLDRLMAPSPVDRTPELQATEALERADANFRSASREAMTWLPRLGYELSRLRAEIGEGVAHSLTNLEQRHDGWIQRDVADAAERLPGVLIEDLRSLQQRADDELAARLAVLVHRFLDGREIELVPGGLRTQVAPHDRGGGLVSVAQIHMDTSSEMFASLGNFSSGRQSIGLLSSVASAVAVPVAVVGGVIGLGFWRLGRKSRQEGFARTQASRWLKVQMVEAGRSMRFRLDQSLNEAQLVLNLAVREHHERAGQEARAALDSARNELTEVGTWSRQEQERSADRLDRIQRLHERSRLFATSGGHHA